MNNITILGSTGSIGVQALEVMAVHGLQPVALAAHSSVQSIEHQARQYRPQVVCLEDEAAAKTLRVALADTPVKVLGGREGVMEAASWPGADGVLDAMVGMAGLEPALAAIEAGKALLLANKEALVCGGRVVMQAAHRHQVPVIPVDSEHSAIFQCLQTGRPRSELKRLMLTASGGPFYGWSRAQLASVTPELALNHPNWRMGPKVTCDSALLLNKGLELMEACWLFDVSPDEVDVVIHPQSIVHSLVEYVDGSVLAQLGVPDMRLPIQYALLFPERRPSPAPRMDLTALGTLSFAAPDTGTFSCLPLAYRAARMGGNAGAAFNAAAEMATASFLADWVHFLQVPEWIEFAMDNFRFIEQPTLQEILQTDHSVRELIRENFISKG